MNSTDKGALTAAHHAKSDAAADAVVPACFDRHASLLSQAEHLAVRKIVGAGPGKIVEGALGNADDVVLDELRAFARAVLRVLERAFPLQHRPAGEVISRELGEDAAEIDLSVAQRAEPACPARPALETAINALPTGGIEFRILDVEGFYARVIDI